MSKAIKVIDLLNKIANGEIPSKIKYKNLIYQYSVTIHRNWICIYR